MEFKNIKILSTTFGLKKKSINYHNNIDGLNYSVECEDIIHPDLHKAMSALDGDLSNAFHILSEDREYFTSTGFVMDEKDGIVTVEIKGHMTNPFGYITKISSGKIPLDETQGKLKDLLETLRQELYKYFFESKTAQGKLEGFPANGKQEQEMAKEDTQGEAVPEEEEMGDGDWIEGTMTLTADEVNQPGIDALFDDPQEVSGPYSEPGAKQPE